VFTFFQTWENWGLGLTPGLEGYWPFNKGLGKNLIGNLIGGKISLGYYHKPGPISGLQRFFTTFPFLVGPDCFLNFKGQNQDGVLKHSSFIRFP